MQFYKDPKEMTLNEYCNCREDTGVERRRRTKLSYGIHSADAIIARFRKYEREYKVLIDKGR